MIIAPPTLLLLLLPPFFYIRTVLYTFPVVGYERERPFLSCVCVYFFFSLALFLSAGASRGRILGRPVDCFRLIGPDSLSTLPSMFFFFFSSPWADDVVRIQSRLTSGPFTRPLIDLIIYTTYYLLLGWAGRCCSCNVGWTLTTLPPTSSLCVPFS